MPGTSSGRPAQRHGPYQTICINLHHLLGRSRPDDFGRDDLDSKHVLCHTNHVSATEPFPPAERATMVETDSGNGAVNEIGARLRAARKRRGLSTGQVAEAAGVTRGFLSQLERDLTSASLGTIARICDALGIRVGELFEAGRADIVRSGEHPKLEYLAGKISELLLTPPSDGRLEVYDSRIAPHTQAEKPYTMRVGTGFIYMLGGTLEFQVGDRVYVIKEGDSFTYAPSESHSWRNPSATEEARLLWVVTGWPAPGV